MSTVSDLLTEKSLGLISEQFLISKEEVLKQSLLAFLEKKSREINSQILQISGKYGIKSIYEFEELYKQGKIEENGTLEDYQQLDHLEFKRDFLLKLIKEMK
jgi:hypothetical protein